ncbi:MAG: pilin [Gammaproteobacteria bacterium]|nr:pilin [Gammaproteobacteria bacterium]
MSEVMARGSEAKTAVTEYFAAKGVMPTNGATDVFNVGGAGKVRTVRWEKIDKLRGRIEIDVVTTAASNGITELDAATNTLAFRGVKTPSGVVQWTCGGTVDTTVPGKYLPGSCK